MRHEKNVGEEMDGKQLVGVDRFHDTFAKTFRFPSFYGRNMDAWIDCMSSLDEPNESMTKIHVGKGNVLTIKISNHEYFKKPGKQEWLDLLECSAFVNHRCTEPGINPLTALAFFE